MLRIKNRVLPMALLVGALLLSAFTGGVNAQAGTTLSFDPATSDVLTTCVDDTLELAVNVANVTNLTAYHLEMSFNTAVVEVLDVVNGELLADPLDLNLYEPTNAWDNTAGTITFGMAQQGTWQANPPATGSGSLIVITLKALVPNHVATFTLNATNSMLVSWPDAMPIAFTVSGTGVVNTNSCAPTNITISNNIVLENKPAGTVVGNFSSVDPDTGDTTFTYSLVGTHPGNAVFTIVGNVLQTSQPLNHELAPGYHTILVRSTDQWGAYFDKEFTVYVVDVNDAPVLGAIGNQSVTEGSLLTFTATATDEDVPADTLTYSLTGTSIPAGAAIDPVTGVFTWTPTEAQGYGVYTFSVQVSDGAAVDYETITVTVGEVNLAPVLGAIGNQSVDENVLLSFDATATDADLPANVLTFSLVGAPTGATINPNTGAFSWTPSESQGGTGYTFTVKVCDNAPTPLCDEEIITVTVAEVNAAPVLAPIGDKTASEHIQMTLTASATDTDLPANVLTYSLVNGPTGATLDPGTGAFSWTPTEAQGPGDFTFTVKVCDNGSPVLCDEEEITITVAEVNVAPILGAIGNKSIPESTLLTFTATATDADLPANTLTFSLTGTDIPAGATIDPATGVFTWTPTEAQGYGVYTFSVQVSDGTTVDYETITVTVTEVNTAPVLGAIGNQSAAEHVLLSFTATATDADLPTNTLSFSLGVGAPAGASIDPVTGVFNWTPSEAQGGGSYSITIKVCDNALVPLCDEETITVTVAETNTAPVAVNDSYSTPKNTLLTVAAPGVLTNDTDSDVPVNTLTVSLVAGLPAGDGALTLNADGSFSFTPAADRVYETSFTYKINDGTADSNVATVTLGVYLANEAPTDILLSNQSIYENNLINAVIGAFSATDLNPADNHTYTLVAGEGDTDNASFNILAANLRASIVFDFEGKATYSIRVRATDQGNLFTEKIFTITILDVNEAPSAANDTQTTPEGTPLSITLVGLDPDNDSLTYAIISGPFFGTLSTEGGVRTYTPGPNFHGTDYFTYQVSDGVFTSNIARVDITITAVNNPPVNLVPGAQTMPEDTSLAFSGALAISVSDADLAETPGALLKVGLSVNNGVLTLSGITGLTFTVGDGTADATMTFTGSPANINAALAELLYVPNADYFGSATLTITTEDQGATGAGGPQTDTDTVLITVTNVQDAPILSPIPAPGTGGEGLPIEFDVVGSDPDGDPLTYSLIDAPVGATIDPLTGEFSWTPTEEQGPGTYTFQICVSDGTDTICETITIVIGEVNAAPVLAAIADMTIDEEVLFTFTATATDEDLPANTLTFAIVGTLPTGATFDPATGAFTWTPTEAQGYGVYSFTIKVCDNGDPVLCDEQLVTITVLDVNVPPVAVDDYYSLDEDGFLSVPVPGVLANDQDHDLNPMAVSLVSGVSHGTLALLADGSFTYRPQPNYNGPDSFVYTLVTHPGTQADAWTDEATVYLTVNPVNDAPVALGESYTTDEDVPLTVLVADGVLLNDTDIDVGDTLTAVLVDGPLHGTVNLALDGSFVYTPAANYNGPDSFTYQAFDGTDYSNTATVALMVNPVADAPVAVDDTYNLREDSTLDIPAPGVLANDTNPDGGGLVVNRVVTQPLHGTLTLNPDGSFTYVPEANYWGHDTFVYEVTDGTGRLSEALVTLNVVGVNDWVVANDDAYETFAGVTLDVVAPGVLANDVLLDPEEAVMLEVSIQPAHGTVTLNNDGSFTYVAEVGFLGVDTFEYLLTSKVMLQEMSTDTALVTITVKPRGQYFLPMIHR